ncbi:MAG: helix-turn-helix transcriptional regulator [Clostridia bacterium]|nr:helix-turn-helix transcriptional regulator [Clostridia bacterium]
MKKDRFHNEICPFSLLHFFNVDIISQLKLALDLNMNQNTISRYETGEREPGINELIKIADYFNVSVDYLLERTDNPKINQ